MTLPTFVINLERHADRRRTVASRCAEVGLAPIFHQGTDASELLQLPPHRPGLTTGEVGCLISHSEVLTQVANMQTDYVLILEDDVHFYSGFSDRLSKVLSFARAHSVPAAQLGWLPLTQKPSFYELARARMSQIRTLRLAASTLKPSIQLTPPPLILQPLGWGAHCYMMSPSVASTLVELMRGEILAPFDHYLAVLPNLLPGSVWRSRFPLAGQDWRFGSSVDQARLLAQSNYQIDERGRRRRHLKAPSDPTGTSRS